MSHKKGSGNRKLASLLFGEDTKLQQFINQRSKWKSVVSMLLAVSLILSLCTGNPFVLAAQQKEEGTAHKHTFTCRELICQEEHEDGDHTVECFESSGPWKCGLSEGEIHTHNQDGYHCWVMAKDLTCNSTKSDADRDGMEADENDRFASGSDSTRSNAKTSKTSNTRQGKHVHTSSCYEEVYECRPDTVTLMRLNPGETAEVATWEELKEAIEADCSVKLTEDIQASGTDLPLIVKSGVSVTVDLNGYTLTYASDNHNLNLFLVEGKGTLTVDDTSGQKFSEPLWYLDETDTEKEVYMCAGMIVGEGVDNVISVEGTTGNEGNLNIKNGRITSINSNRAVFSRGKVTMTGGYIIDNHNPASPSLGGGVRLTDTASFTMTGGFIANNSAERGGGIYSIGTVSIGGNAVLCGNTADFGGAVCSPDNKTVQIQIKGNACINGNITNDRSSKVIDGTNVSITENAYVQGIVSGLEKLIDNTANGDTLKLDKDYTVLFKIGIHKNIVIDLNGYTVTYDGYDTDSEIFLVEGANAVLTIQDTKGNGGLKSGINGLDRLVKVENGGKLTLKSGTLENQNGLHGILVNGSSMEMTGGTIENCGKNANGGGILMTNGSQLDMSGGTIIRNRALNGGGIDVLNSKAIINGTAKIIKNEAAFVVGTVSGTGGGIRVRGNSKVTIAGSADISANIAGKKGGGIRVGEDSVSKPTSSTVVVSENAVISGNIAETGGAIYGEGNGYNDGNGNEQYIVELINSVKVIGNVSTGTDPDSSKVVVVNPSEKLHSTIDFADESQMNMLGQDIQATYDSQSSTLDLERSYIESGAITIDRELTIDLKGHIIIFNNGNNDGKLFHVTENGKLIIKDSSGSSGTIISREGTPDSLICVTGGQLRLIGGTLKNINGSHGIQAEGGTITIEGGQIANSGTKITEGGGIYLKGSVFQMSGGQITDNIGERGGGIYAADSSGILISGGSISNNTAPDSGGGLYIRNSASEISGTAEIANNVADLGGGISFYEGARNTLVVKGNAKISENTAKGTSRRNKEGEEYDKFYGGGGIYANEGTIVTLQGECVISGNISEASSKVGRGGGGNGGGGIFSRGTVVMEGGTVSGNYAEDAGGGIYVAGMPSKFTMSGGVIDGNTAHKDEGGGLRIDWNGTITAGRITNNRTETQFDWGGGGVFINTGANVEIQNLLVTENTADGFGGGVGGCSTGNVQIFALKGAGIYDNHANGTGLTKRGDGTAKSDDRTIVESTTFYPVFLEGGFQDFYSAGNSIVYSHMLGGGDADWVGTYANSLRKVDGNKQFDPEDWGLINISGNSSKFATGWMALTAAPQAEDRQKAERIATVFVSGNTSTTHGGGIMSNGTLKLGEGSQAGLIISKKVNGLSEDQDKEFEFEIELSHSVGLADSYCYRKIFNNEESGSGTLEFKNQNQDQNQNQNRKASFSLVDNESIEIFDLPVGTQYKVTEKNGQDYQTNITVCYENVEEITNGAFTLNSEIGEQTDYKISFLDQNKSIIQGPYSYHQGGDGKEAGQGQEVISLHLNAGESIQMVPPGGVRYYKIRSQKTTNGSDHKSTEGIIYNNGENGQTEIRFENYKSGLILKKINTVHGEESKPFRFTLTLSSQDSLKQVYQRNGKGAKVINVTENSSSEGHTKKWELELADGGIIKLFDLPKDTKYTVEETRVNDYITSILVHHTKFHSFQKGMVGTDGRLLLNPVQDGTEGTEKSIQIKLMNPEGTELKGSFPYQTQNGVTAYLQSGSKISVKENDTLVVSGLPEGTGYECSLVMARKEGNQLTGMVYDDSMVEIDVTNAKSGQLNLHGKKELRGGELAEGSFTFALKADQKTPMPEGSRVSGDGKVKEVKNRSDGTFSFGTIVYEKEGVYRYQIEEVNEGKSGITYDRSIYKAVVTVTKGLYAELHMEKIEDGKDPMVVEEVMFVNIKKPTNPEDPKNPSDPKEPENPKDPSDPKEPENPKDPSDPKEPENPKDPSSPTDPENPPTRPHPDSPGGNGGGNDPADPTNPPVQPSEPMPGEPTQPEEPAPTPESAPSEEMETPILPELPDPNAPNSPDRVIIMEDGVPRAYRKVWDPETEEFVYLPEDEIPLAGKMMPRTGDSSRTNMWLIVWLLSLMGAGISWEARRRKNHRKDSL